MNTVIQRKGNKCICCDQSILDLDVERLKPSGEGNDVVVGVGWALVEQSIEESNVGVER